MRRLIITSLFFFIACHFFGQVAPDKYVVEFTDKNNSPWSLDRPEEFLTQRALDRREKSSIPIVISDLPVNPDYVEAVAQTGVTVLNRLRWFNGVIIEISDTAQLTAIGMLPFVAGIVKNQRKEVTPDAGEKKLEQELLEPLKSIDTSLYGRSYTQVHMVRTDLLHAMGYRGKGIVVAVLDAGFLNANVLPAFDSLFARNQILGTRDFVTPGGDVYQTHYHGMSVLSVMGGLVPGQLIGTAPDAAYWLLRSEDVSSEYLIEEYNWVCAAEYADSVGADIINSSLGYRVFNDPSQDHTCADMTGNTTPVTRGANMAFSKGILVVNSAGNEGENPSWPCMGAPADGFDVLAIAAVDSLGLYASFSSTGVVAGTYVKPNVAGMGRLTVLSTSDGTIGRSSGTSFSSPVIAGSAASLWQAFPRYSNATIKVAIEQSASQYLNPDIYLGYGIPDMMSAWEQLTGVESPSGSASLVGYPNPYTGQTRFFLSFSSEVNQQVEIRVYSVAGQLLGRDQNHTIQAGQQVISTTILNDLPAGTYILRLLNTAGSSPSSAVLIQKL